MTVNGGVAPFTYNWFGGIGNIPNPTGLPAGVYNVVVTGADGCTATTQITINGPTAISINIDANNAGCNGGLGSATANVSGGTPGYSYLWSDGQVTQTASGLVAGTYTVTITDANGCTEIATTTISAGGNIGVVISAQDVSCHEGNDGAASVSVQGGNAPINFVWSTGDNGPVITGLVAGTYTVTATDASGCTATAETNIISAPAIILNLSLIHI